MSNSSAARRVPTLADLYEGMLRIRKFEERVAVLYREGHIPGFSHVSIGQESVPVGVASVLRDTDVITSTHRGHGHVLAKGADMHEMFAELIGRGTGSCGGLGGSMHIADVSKGVFGANGIVGAGIPIAVGAGFATAQRTGDDVAVCFFGDGAVSQGAFHEGVNLATLWHLPVLFVCENNHWAEFTPSHEQHPVPPHERARAYGIEATHVDGTNVEAVAEAARELLELLRTGSGPALLEVEVERWHGHYEGDPVAYQSEEDREAARAHDPLAHARARLSDHESEAIEARVAEEVAEAEAKAVADPPAEVDLYALTYARRPEPAEERIDVDRQMRYMDGVNTALHDAMSADERVFVAGIDVGAAEGIFRVTRGLLDTFGPDRVRDTPIAEMALMGLGVGSAMAGMRPVVELMFIDFLGVCLDQLMNQAAKLRFMTGGQVEVPLVVRTQFGAGRSSGAQHSQSLEGMLASIPGLTVVMPTTPADAYGLLRSAIEDVNPVVFIEHRHLYGTKGPAPSEGHRVPLGRAKVVRAGGDATVVASGRMVHRALEASRVLAEQDIEIDVVDLRTIVPLDMSTILDRVSKTGRLVVAHEAHTQYGPGAEIVAAVCEAAGRKLKAPPRRVGADAVPAPYAKNLEQEWLPATHEVVKAVLTSVERD